MREARLADWECRTGHPLPADYRAFMVSHGGGLPFPNEIRISDPALAAALGDETVVLFELFDWPRVEAHHRGEVHLSATPSDLLLIWDLEAGLHLALSLRAGDAGTTHLWRASGQVWGGPGNGHRDLTPFAPSFSDVLGALTETADAAIGRRVWEAGSMRSHARRVNR